MNRASWVLLGSIGIVALCIVSLRQTNTRSTVSNSNSGQKASIQLFCAAANRTAIELIRKDYEKEFGRAVDIQYGPSQSLLSSVEISQTGDLLMPSDDSYMEMAKQKHLVAEVIPVASMRPVIVVKKGNPKAIHRLDDLLGENVRLVQSNPDTTAIGHITRQTLRKTGDWGKLEKATRGFRTTVTEAASDVAVGSADAAIVFDAVVFGNPELEIIQVDAFQDQVANVSMGVIATTQQPTAALHFARYVAARDRGMRRYAEQGFVPVQGDVWNDVPELTLYAGSMLRPALESTLIDFEKREGVKITRVYNGCGILVAQMKAGQKPDAYFACDTEFMKAVPDLFPRPLDISSNQLVILVQKGNPKGIRSLRDLGNAGLRVGVGHEKQCAMGWITQNVFREGGVTKEIMSNVTVQSPTGDMLVNQLQAGALDAAVAYLSNAAGKGEFLDAIQIQGIACSVATQPFAIADQSDHAVIMQRLLNKIRSDESREIFLAEGFTWQMGLTDRENTTQSVNDGGQ